MISNKMFLQSRFARRIIAIFISCSLIPLLALFVFSYQRITEDLKNQNLLLLKQVTKSISVSIYERLLFLEAEMQLITAKIPRTAGDDFAQRSIVYPKAESDRFQALAIYNRSGKKITVLGATDKFPELSNPEFRALEKTGATIITRRPSDQLPRYFMATSYPRSDNARAYILGEINKEYFRQVISENLLPAMTDFIILDSSQNILVSSIKPDKNLFGNMANLTGNGVSGHFLWRFNDKAHRAGFNKLFLKSKYSIPDWTIILLQPDDYTLKSLNDFKTIFPLVILLSLLIVIFLTLIFVRKSLISLEKLKDGTHRIVDGNFKDIDNISSGDEFGDLADAFNIMANKLNLQLNELSLSAAIGHFSTKIQDTDELIDAIMDSVKKRLNFDRAALILLNDTTSRLHYKSGYGYATDERDSFTFFFNARRTINSDNPIGKALLSKQPVFSIIDDKSAIRHFPETASLSGKTPDALSIYVPIVYEDKSIGALVLENTSKKRIPITIDSEFLLGFGSQIAVCLSNNTSRQKLQESEERFRKAFDHVASGISLVSTDGDFLTVNAYLLKMLGYKEKDFLNKTLKTISNPGHFLAEKSSHQRLLNKEIESDIYEKLFIHKTGHQIWGLVSISLLFDKNNRPLYYIMNVQNLSELKEAEKIQKELESRLQRACK
jgi:PAS domain S-box-containing protein